MANPSWAPAQKLFRSIPSFLIRDGFSAVMGERSPEGILLKAIQVLPAMIKKHGLWVHTGNLPLGFDIMKAVRDDREERMRKLAGL
jgi:hypothetical protein